MAFGAALLGVGTAPGTCFFLYRWITTGDVTRLGEAAALFFVASLMGGAGGLAYHLVLRSRIGDFWKPFAALFAAVEAYLLVGSLAILAISRLAPSLNSGVPADLRFFLGLHAYGALLCVTAFGVAFAPRIAKVLVISLFAVQLLLSGVMYAILLILGPERLDLSRVPWKALSIACGLSVAVLVAVSVVGWGRYFRNGHMPPTKL